MESSQSEGESVLLVEADPEEMERLRSPFEGLAFSLIEASSVEEAVTLVKTQSPVLVMSEIVLPDASGFSLCRRLREDPSSNTIRVVLLSRWTTEADRILAFQCGADDFVAKPFFVRELSSRIQAVLRRSQNRERKPKTDFTALVDPIEFRVESYGVRIGQRFITLTPREHALLVALIERRGLVMSRNELIEKAWRGGDLPNARNVDAHVKSLRRKLDLSPDPIETVRGIGYRFGQRTRVGQSS